jgi:hypothetical protein
MSQPRSLPLHRQSPDAPFWTTRFTPRIIIMAGSSSILMMVRARLRVSVSSAAWARASLRLYPDQPWVFCHLPSSDRLSSIGLFRRPFRVAQ